MDAGTRDGYAAGKVHVVGIPPGSLVPGDLALREIVEGADLLVGREDLIAPWKGRATLPLKGDLEAIISRAGEIAAKGGQVVFLVNGDPDFFGIAPLLRKRLGKERVMTYPATSSMQLAFSRIGESWHDARFLSAHARPLEEVLSELRGCRKACVLTSDGDQPAALARALVRSGMRHFRVFLCQDLGSDDEWVEELTLEELGNRKCRPLNLLLLMYDGPRSETGSRSPLLGVPDELFATSPASPSPAPTPPTPLLGIPDELFATPPGRRGRMTKRDLRAIAVSRLELSPHETLWDVGAGCGTLSVEASRLLFRGRVYAVEEDEEDIELIKTNIRRFGAANVHPVKGVAPDVFGELPFPDAVFVGGSSGRLEDIALGAAEKLAMGGRMVIHLVGLERVQVAVSCLEQAGMEYEVFLHQAYRFRELGGAHVMDPQTPVFVVSGVKAGGGEGR